MRVPLRTLLQSLDEWAARGRTVEVAPFTAVGCWLARDIRSPGPVPAQAIALRDGFAVEALALVGASAQNPVPLMAATRISIGEALPQGADAVIDPASIEQHGRMLTALDTIEPGAGIRRAGHDLAAGALIAAQGSRVTPEIAFAAHAAGLASLPVAEVTYRIETGDDALNRWFASRFAAMGAAAVEARADIEIIAAAGIPAQLALSPTEAVQIDIQGVSLRITAPARLDTAMAVWCAVVLPIIARRMGIARRARPVRIRQKIASTLGMADVALLRVTGDDAEVLATGDLPLCAIAAANAFVIIDPASEGEAEGTTVEATPLDAPFAPLPCAPLERP